VGYVAVFEAAHDVSDRVGFADVSEKLVAKAFAFRSARDEAGDVSKLDRRWYNLLRLNDVGELGESRIGDRHDARVWLDGAEREVFRGDAGLGERVKER